MPIPTDLSTVEVWNPNKVYRGVSDGPPMYVKYQGGLWLANYYSVGENPSQSDPSGYGAWRLAGMDANEDGDMDDVGDRTVQNIHKPVYRPVAPEKVEGVQAVRTTDKEIAITWKQAYVPGLGDVTSYNIYQNGVKIGSTTDTSFLVKNLTANTSYNFQVEAINLAVGTNNNNGTYNDTSDDSIWQAQKSDVAPLTTADTEIQSAKYYSPFMDMTLPSTNLVELAKSSGVKDFTLAFMQGLKSQISGVGPDATLIQGEKPIVGWGGITNTTLPEGVIIDQVREVQKMGGEITISFGGYTGRDIAVLAKDYGRQLDGNYANGMTATEEALAVKHLTSQFQSVIDTYGVKRLDFDIENSTISGDDADKYKTINDSDANHIRNLAIKQLQADNPGLFISYTVATTPNGLNNVEINSGRVLDMFAQAKADGVRIDVVNIMAMDYFSGAVNIDMGQTAINAAKAVYAQLTNSPNDPVNPGLGMTGVKIGITPMIGLNDYWNVPDNMKEIFTLQDAQEVIDFAKMTPWVAGVGAWQLTRDREHSVDTTKDDGYNQGPNDPAPANIYPNGQLPNPSNGNKYPGPDPDHSDLQQGEWDFSKIFGKITKEATNGADIIAGGDENNNFKGLGGADLIYGNGGSDIIDGGTGADTMRGGAGNDNYTVDNLADLVDESIVGSSGTDTVLSSTVNVDLTNMARFLGNIEQVVLQGSANLNATGNGLANAIVGNAGNNQIDGRIGSDIMRGLGGNDLYTVDNVADIVDEAFAGSGGLDTVRTTSISVDLSNAARYMGDIEQIVLEASQALNATGNALANNIVGNAGANIITGGLGLDRVMGNGGADTFVFRSAADSSVGAGRDVILDFEDVGDNDTIDLSGFAGTLAFIGGAAFTAANQVRAVVSGADVLVEINTTGVSGAESQILLANTAIGVVDATDFIL